MAQHEESPKIQLERDLCIGGLILVAGGVVGLLAPLFRQSGGVHTWRFLLVSLLIAVGVYLARQFTLLTGLRYMVRQGVMVLAMGGKRMLEIPAERMLGLHRWRGRWLWSGMAENDLQVAALEHFPPLWVGVGGTWVLVYITVAGERRGVVFHPSQRLLHAIRDELKDRRAAG